MSGSWMNILAAVVWQNADLAALAVAVASVALAAVLWLYPPQLRDSSRGMRMLRWHWLLPALRGAVIVALAVSLLKPVAARPRKTGEPGAILLLVDQSASMSVNDAGRSPQEKVELARGLGLIPAGAATPTAGLASEVEQLRGLLERVWRARSEAEYARLSGRGVEDARRRLEQQTSALRSAAAALAGRAASLEKDSDPARRLEELRKLPAPLDERALRDLRARLEQLAAAAGNLEARAAQSVYESDPRVRDRCDELDRSSRIELVKRVLNGPQALMEKLTAVAPVTAYGFAQDVTPLRLESIGDRSQIAGALRWAQQYARTQPVRAVVLVSDGRQTGQSDVQIEPQPSATPVFTVPVSPPRPRRDVLVKAVRAPQAVYVAESVSVQVDVRAVACAEQTIEVFLSTPGGRQTRQIKLADAVDLSVEFQVRFAQPGAVELSAGVAPIAGEASDANNHLERWLKVLPGSIAVTVASESRSREFLALTESLQNVPWISLNPILLSGYEDEQALMSDQILRQGAIVLCDVRSWALGDAQWEATERLVTERGGAVILAAGESDVLRGYAQHPIASRLLPFDPAAEVSWRVWPGDKPQYRLAAGAWSGAGDPLDQPNWRNLSPVMAYVSMPQLTPNARALLVERETKAPVLAEARLGLGRCYVLGTDETWRWRAGGATDSAFWETLLRRAAEEPYAAHEQNHSLDVDEVAARTGQPLHVRAKVLREDGSPSPATWQDLLVLKDGYLVRTIRLNASTIGPGRYEAFLSDLTEGQYELRLSTGDDLAPAPRLVVRVSSSTGYSEELVNLSGDQKLLADIAQSTGGEMVSLEQIGTLPQRIASLREREPKVQFVQYALWDSPYLFLFVLSGLSLEWALRKRIGLV